MKTMGQVIKERAAAAGQGLPERVVVTAPADGLSPVRPGQVWSLFEKERLPGYRCPDCEWVLWPNEVRRCLGLGLMAPEAAGKAEVAA
jgi:hypothetical protein